jgi:hypothetical protein
MSSRLQSPDSGAGHRTAGPCYRRTTTPVTAQVDQIDTCETLNGSRQHGSTSTYNTNGQLTSRALLLVMWHNMWHTVCMASMNMRQLRDTRRLKAWLQAGKTVELRERDRVLGHIVPNVSAAEPSEWPDFAARVKEIFGKRRAPGAALVIKERGRY